MPKLSNAVKSKEELKKEEINWLKYGEEQTINNVILAVITIRLIKYIKLDRFHMELNVQTKQWKAYENFDHSVFLIILGQCNKASKCKIKAHDNYKTTSDEQCSVRLINVMKKVACLATYRNKGDKNY